MDLFIRELKKLTAILLLAVFLFNVGGYYLVFYAMQHHARNKLLKRLDAEQYHDQETMVLTIPMSLPYPIHSAGYERIDGEFEYHGQAYKLVKQKLENDTLFLVCVRDVHASRIANAFHQYVTMANDLPSAASDALMFLSKMYKDFNTREFVLHFRSRDVYEHVLYADATPSLLTNHFPVESPPPDVFSDLLF